MLLDGRQFTTRFLTSRRNSVCLMKALASADAGSHSATGSLPKGAPLSPALLLLRFKHYPLFPQIASGS
jgi:hypothetical protein